MIHVFQECLDCSDDRLVVDVKLPSSLSREYLETLDKKQLLAITNNKGLPGNKQTSKTKLITTIESY